VAQVDEAQTYLISGSGQHGRRGARCPIGDQPVRCAVRPVTGLPHATREALCLGLSTQACLAVPNDDPSSFDHFSFSCLFRLVDLVLVNRLTRGAE